MLYCSWEGREFPDTEFEVVGTQYVHTAHPRHNTLGELVDIDGRTVEPGIPEAVGDAGSEGTV
jgi:hypothetical protein